MIRVLVLGATGMLGHKLVQGLQTDFELHATARANGEELIRRGLIDKAALIPNIEAGSPSLVNEVIAHIRPDFVINCIGIIKQLRLANDPISSIAINGLFPHQLADMCANVHARLIHFSTDCVFSGNKGAYSEQDNPDPVDMYGRTKLIGEVDRPNSLTLRSSIIGREINSSYGLVEWFLKNDGKHVNGYRKAIYSGITTGEMASVVAMIMSKYADMSGIYQLASSPINKYELLRYIQSSFGTTATIEPVDEPAIDRSLDGSRFSQETGWMAPSWAEMIEDMAHDA